MTKVELITNEDFKKFKEIFNFAKRGLGWDKEDGVKVIQNNKEFILFYANGVFMKFGYDSDNRVIKNTIQIDDNEKVLSFTITNDGVDYQVIVNHDYIYLIDENGLHQSLHLRKDNSNPELEIVSNGLLDYIQYDSNRDIRMLTRYEQYVPGSVDDRIIYSDFIKKPYYISCESSVSKRKYGLFFLGRKDSYYRMDFDIWNNKWQYDLATLQEFGVDAVISSRTIALHNGQTEFSRYYRVLFNIGDYFTVTGFPFLRQYTEKDIEKIILDSEFSSKIPMFIIDIYNRRNVLLKENQEIVDEYSKLMNTEFNVRKGK